MSIKYADTTKIGDEFRSEIVAAIEPEPLSDLEYMALLQRRNQERAKKALRMYNLWQEGLLPADVVVIEVPIERTGYGYFRIPEYGPPKVMVADEDRNPAPDDRIRVIEIELGTYRNRAGDWMTLGWNEYPPRLIVGREKDRA